MSRWIMRFEILLASCFLLLASYFLLLWNVFDYIYIYWKRFSEMQTMRHDRRFSLLKGVIYYLLV